MVEHCVDIAGVASSILAASTISQPHRSRTAYLAVGGRFTVQGYVDNIFDKRYIVLGDDVGGLIARQYDNIGRTFGVKVGATF